MDPKEKKLRWNSNIFIDGNTFEYVVCEMLAILSRPQCVNDMPVFHCGDHSVENCGSFYYRESELIFDNLTNFWKLANKMLARLFHKKLAHFWG